MNHPSDFSDCVPCTFITDYGTIVFTDEHSSHIMRSDGVEFRTSEYCVFTCENSQQNRLYFRWSQ